MDRQTARTLAFALAAVLLVGGLALAAYATQPAPEESREGDVGVVVVGPGGRAIFNGTVALGNGTALTALMAAAEAGGFEVRTQQYPFGTYVEAIDGHAARGSAGWLYEVERDGERVLGDRAADRFPVRPGDTVVWRWSDAPG